MERFRSYMLPVAMVMGLLLHKWCGQLAFLAPYLIFTILLLNFVAVDLRKLHLTKLNVWIMVFQTLASVGGYFLIRAIFHNELLAQGVFMGILCPVAASVVVVSCMLGANRETITEYTIFGNLLIVVIAPFYFSFIGLHQDMAFGTSFWMIFKKVSSTIALPFFVALLLQLCWPKANDFLSRYKDITFYIWAFLLLLTLGRTIDFVFLHGQGNGLNILWLGIASILVCALNFGLGKWVGRHYHDTIAGGQLMGQKNTAFGIWMATVFLNPLATVFLAFYSIWQNLFNSWQIWRFERRSVQQPQSPLKS